MNAVIVSVDFADLLAITLPYNRHHFDQVMVVTAPGDERTLKVAEGCECRYLVTDAFYQGGADFNKWLALEEGLDALGRQGWLCLMDADVLWPKWLSDKPGEGAIWRWLRAGFLYSPLRRMWEEWPSIPAGAYGTLYDTKYWVPNEDEWRRWPLHPQQHEWAGYSQIFHASDPVLGPPPWHQTDWRHAGGADSFFQAKWPPERKVRPPFSVLHLGPAGQNWCGRVTRCLDGSVPEHAEERRRKVVRYLRSRRRGSPDPYKSERLG